MSESQRYLNHEAQRLDQLDPFGRMSREMTLVRDELTARIDAIIDANRRPGMEKFTEEAERVVQSVADLGELECALDTLSANSRLEWLSGELSLPADPADADHNGKGNGNGDARHGVEALTR